MDKTIAKNRKKLIDAIAANAHYVKNYDEQTGKMLPGKNADWLPREMLMYRSSRLTMNENGLCRFHVNSNNFSHFKVSDEIVKQVFK